jgi:hypothetical protein
MYFLKLMLGVSTCLVTILVGAEYWGVATILPMVVTLTIIISLLYLGSALLHTTRDDEMTKKTKGFTFENFVIFSYIYIYRIQIVQKITQLSCNGRFNQSPLFLIH